jgi:hypothetical protein
MLLRIGMQTNLKRAERPWPGRAGLTTIRSGFRIGKYLLIVDIWPRECISAGHRGLTGSTSRVSR